jgi:gluconate 2-dehydrogenase gamma chain
MNMNSELSRRRFLAQAGAGVSAAWVTAHWPQMLSAAAHARQSAQSSAAGKFEFLTPDEAVEVEALSNCIIPSDDTPGAREAGVIFFIDRALVTFAREEQPKYRNGVVQLQALVHERFPGVQKFSAATPDQQNELLRAMYDTNQDTNNRRINRTPAENFFDSVRVATISGFLIDPEAQAGNRGGVGWKLIGRDPAHMFQPPFGYYDQNYPGWHPVTKAADNK